MTWINNDMQHRKITKNSGVFQYYELLILAAQFVAWFKWSNPGIALAIRGARITRLSRSFFPQLKVHPVQVPEGLPSLVEELIPCF